MTLKTDKVSIKLQTVSIKLQTLNYNFPITFYRVISYDAASWELLPTKDIRVHHNKVHGLPTQPSYAQRFLPIKKTIFLVGLSHLKTVVAD